MRHTFMIFTVVMLKGLRQERGGHIEYQGLIMMGKDRTRIV